MRVYVLQAVRKGKYSTFTKRPKRGSTYLTRDQAALVKKAQESLRAAKLLAEDELYDFAALRAYYAMFYIAEAFLLEEALHIRSIRLSYPPSDRNLQKRAGFLSRFTAI